METRRILIDNGFYLDFRYEGLILSNILFVLLDVLNESLLSKTIDTLSQLSTLKIVISSKNIEDKNFFEYTEDLILRKISNGNLNQSRIQQEVSFAKHTEQNFVCILNYFKSLNNFISMMNSKF